MTTAATLSNLLTSNSMCYWSKLYADRCQPVTSESYWDNAYTNNNVKTSYHDFPTSKTSPEIVLPDDADADKSGSAWIRILTPILSSLTLTTLLLLLAALLVAVCYQFVFKRSSNSGKHRPSTVPGPRWFPILGTWDVVTHGQRLQPYELLQHFAKEHGDCYGVYLGSNMLIVLSSYKAVKETFIKHGNSFVGRADNVVMDKFYSKGKHGLLFSDGQRWKEQRQFAHKLLRELGVNKVQFEEAVHTEVERWLKILDSQPGVAVDLGHLFDLGPANAISQLIVGRRYEYNDAIFLRFKQIVDELTDIIVKLQTFIGSFPWLRFVPFDPVGIRRYQRLTLEGEKHLTDIIDDHCVKIDYENPRDFVDHYLVEMRRQQATGKPHFFTMTQLQVAVNDLIGAGTETITLALRWSVLFLLHHPEVQLKLQQQIDEVVGQTRHVTLHDRKHLPYVDAFIHEVQRRSRAVAASVIHETVEPVEALGHKFPARTRFLLNLYGIHADADYWGADVNEFKPERFLTEDGKFTKPEGWMCFGAGKRVCLGETAAQCEMFLFVTALLQHFAFMLPVNAPLPTLVPRDRGNLHPQPFKVLCVRRSSSLRTTAA